MIIAASWRLDPFEDVLLVGGKPFAAVRQIPGKKQFSSSVLTGSELLRATHPTAEAGRKHVEAVVDQAIRSRLTQAARDALAAAGL